MKILWWIVPISLLGIAANLYQSPKGDLGSRVEFSSASSSGVKTDCEHTQPWSVLPGQYFTCRGTYAISMNPDTKMADWVAYCVNETSITGSSEQNRKWKSDPDFPESVQLEPDDYQQIGKLGYDRGHQAPLATFRGENWEETNYTTNITPQKAELNRGAWLALEKHERSLVKRHGEICTLTGPYYQQNLDEKKKLPNADERHFFPSGYWKIISYNNGKVEAYLYSQDTPAGVDFKLGAVSVSEVESYSGLKIN